MSCPLTGCFITTIARGSSYTAGRILVKVYVIGYDAPWADRKEMNAANGGG